MREEQIPVPVRDILKIMTSAGMDRKLREFTLIGHFVIGKGVIVYSGKRSNIRRF